MTGYAWLDLRVAVQDAPATVAAVAAYAFSTVGLITIDLNPPAIGPEAEVSVQLPANVARAVTTAVERAGIEVLAHRVRDWPRGS